MDSPGNTVTVAHKESHAWFMCYAYLSSTLSQACYERALEVFELVEDHDKVVKVLVNLSNMCELQVIMMMISRLTSRVIYSSITVFIFIPPHLLRLQP